MRLKGPAPQQQKPKVVKGLLIVLTITMLSSFGLGLWSSLASGYSAVLRDEDIAMIQLDAPQSGQKAAIVHTSLGDMQFTLYPEECPQTVENFCSLAESGYYNDTYVFELAPSVFFAAGAATAAGDLPAGKEGSPQERIPQELSPKLWPFRGALCAMQTTTEGGFWKTLTKTQETYTGSRFLVCNSIEMTEEIEEGLRSVSSDAMKQVGEAFIEKVGIPNYAQQLTGFGQLTDGFDVLDAITGAEVGDSETVADGVDVTRPKDEIRIHSVEIMTLP